MRTHHQKPAMAPDPGEPAGMERENKGWPIPLRMRLPDDRANTERARAKKENA